MGGLHPRTALRLLVAAVTLALLAVWFHKPLFTLLGGLAAPGGLSARRLTLALLAGLSVLPPLMLANVLADALYDRYLAD